MSRRKRALLFCSVFLTLVVLIEDARQKRTGRQQSTPEDNEIVRRNENSPSNPVEIDPNVFEPYDRTQWPQAFTTWGEVRFAQISKVRERAARAAAANPLCDRVEMAELSPSRSRPPLEIVILVDCRNGIRFHFREGELP